jgi:beta-galactosidase
LGKFTDNDFVDSPVIVKNNFGKGTTLYTAAFPSVSLLGKLIDETLAIAGIAAGIDTPEYVEVLNRGEYTFIINHRAEPVAVSMPAGKVIIGEYKDGKVILGAHDLCLMRNM